MSVQLAFQITVTYYFSKDMIEVDAEVSWNVTTQHGDRAPAVGNLSRVSSVADNH